MVSFKTKGPFFRLYSWLPSIILIVAVLNEFDFNYLNLKYFSFNFPFILIFFFTLKDTKHFDYLFVFIAGLVNLFGPKISGPAFFENTGSVIIVVSPNFIRYVA